MEYVDMHNPPPKICYSSHPATYCIKTGIKLFDRHAQLTKLQSPGWEHVVWTDSWPARLFYHAASTIESGAIRHRIHRLHHHELTWQTSLE